MNANQWVTGDLHNRWSLISNCDLGYQTIPLGNLASNPSDNYLLNYGPLGGLGINFRPIM